MNKEKGIIYLLTNKVNGKQYVGRTININRRIREHKAYNQQVVDKAIDKYGWDSFTVEVLVDNVPKSELDTREKKYIKKYNTFTGRGYNCTPGGQDWDGKDHPMYGKQHTKETKQKIREAHLGKTLSEETKKKIGIASLGRKHTEEAKEKISEALSGRKRTEEHIEKLRQANLGKEVSEEARQNMREGQLGRHHPEEVKKKISEAQIGEKNHRSKITEEEAKEIKKKYEGNKNTLQKDLAEGYGISNSLVSLIVREEHWATKKQKEAV